MFAEVYPLKRLPRRFGVFDYTIPEGMNVRRGMFVRVPFRSTAVWGVVARVKETTDRKLKTIVEANPNLVLSESELAYLESIAEDVVQSPSTILYVSLPALPKKQPTIRQDKTHAKSSITLPKDETEALQQTVRFLKEKKRTCALVGDLRRTAAVIAGYTKSEHGATLVLAPNVRDAQLLARHLGALLVTGEETQAQRRQTWFAWRHRGGILVGSRAAALLPHPDLQTIFVARSSHENHKQGDRNPRFDARKAALLRGQSQNARVYFLDACIRPDELAAAPDVVNAFPTAEVKIADMRKERSVSPHPMLSASFSAAAEKTLASGKRVLCVYNRKGVSKRMRCQDCAHVFACPKCTIPFSVHENSLACHRCGASQPLPIECPQCHSHDLLSKGFGNQQVAHALRKHFPTHSIAVLEKDSLDSEADILLVTRHYTENVFDPFVNAHIGLVADLDADLPLYQPHMRALESAAVSALEWRGVAQALRAPLLLQTESSDVLQPILTDPVAAMHAELETRIAYSQPPATRHMTVTHADKTIERIQAQHPPESFRNLPDSDIIDTWADS